jgi:hypothetical protein
MNGSSPTIVDRFMSMSMKAMLLTIASKQGRHK